MRMVIAPSDVAGIPSLSTALLVGDFIFISGQAAVDAATHEVIGETIGDQVVTTLCNVRRVLETAGATLDDVVRVDAYLARESDRAGFNEAYTRFFREPRPCRTTVVVGLGGRLLVELTCIAQRPASATPSEQPRATESTK